MTAMDSVRKELALLHDIRLAAMNARNSYDSARGFMEATILLGAAVDAYDDATGGIRSRPRRSHGCYTHNGGTK